MAKANYIHLNVPQINVQLVGATENYLVWGRGTGKSTGAIAPWLVARALEMPRSMGGIVGATFQQLLVRTLPPVFAQWKAMGYVNGIHYVYGKEPTAAWKRMWNWQEPVTKPLHSQYAIYWFNGSCQVLISQDRIGSSNGLSLAYVANDEAKLTNMDRFGDEVSPTLRGHKALFGKAIGFGGMIFSTDMPTSQKGKWILDKKELMDVGKIQLIRDYQLNAYDLLLKRNDASKASTKKFLTNQIKTIERKLYRLRLGAKDPDDKDRKISVYYSEASAFDNIDVLGHNYINRMKQTLKPEVFDTAIANKKSNTLPGGFYPNFDPDTHGKNWINYEYLDSFIGRTDPEPNWRQDGGMLPKEPLDIAFDYGQFNCMIVGQMIGKQYRFLKEFEAYSPQLLQDVVRSFVTYYEGYPCKVVNYYHDQTARQGYANTRLKYYETVIEELRDAGWTVRNQKQPRTPNHEVKYDIINRILKGDDPSFPSFAYNRGQCRNWEISVANAGVKQGSRGFEKDKSPERDKSLDQAKTTHYSDAGDTLLYFRVGQSATQSSYKNIIRRR